MYKYRLKVNGEEKDKLREKESHSGERENEGGREREFMC